MDAKTAFFELFGSLPRQGPGSAGSTLSALDLLRTHLPPEPEVLELGCGSGGATVVLAQALDARIIAVDVQAELLSRCARACSGLRSAVRTLQADMGRLPVQGPFDLLWSEGAAYSIGTDQALEQWKPLLRPNGGLALTELCWHSTERPPAVDQFFTDEGARVWEEAELRATAQAAGYQVLGMPRLPRQAWWDSYYGPLRRRVQELQAEWTEPGQRGVLDQARAELGLFEEWGETYGYTWLVALRGA